MKTYLSFILLFSAALATPVAGQLFPYDRTIDAVPVGNVATIAEISDHTRYFGDDTVTLEIYLDLVEEVPAPGGWAYRTRCTETCYLGKKEVAGKFNVLLSTEARTTLLIYLDHMPACLVGRYLEIHLELSPDGNRSRSIQRFGDWPPPGAKRS